MDNSRYNAYGTHCLNDIVLHIATPMGDEEQNDTLYILRKQNAPREFEYVIDTAHWRGDPCELMVTFIDLKDAQRVQQNKYPEHEIEEISGKDLVEKLSGKFGINFRYVAGGKEDEINVPPQWIEQYDEYQQQGRPKVSTSKFLASLPRVPHFLPPKKMKAIRDTFERLGIEGAVVTVATVDLMGAVELVVDFDRDGGFTCDEIQKIERANKRLQMRFEHPVGFLINAEIDHTEPPEQEKPARNKPERDPAEMKRIREQRKNRKQKIKNGKSQPEDNFVCAELTNKIKRKQKTMEHPLVQHLAQAQEIREYQPIIETVLRDESFDLFMHFDLKGEYIVTKDGVDIFLDEYMWRRSFNSKQHNEDQPQKTIRELLEFTEENQCAVRLFYPDKDGLDFITIPFEQLHAYHDLMPREITTNIDELRVLPRVDSPQAQKLCEQAYNTFFGVPGTAPHVYMADAQGHSVLVVEIEELKPLTDITDEQLYGRSKTFEEILPKGIEYRFKIVPPIQRESRSNATLPRSL